MLAFVQALTPPFTTPTNLPSILEGDANHFAKQICKVMGGSPKFTARP
jgi:hypothetical protein